VFYSHEANHIIAEKHGGVTALDNLAWACATCNRFKGTNIASVDPQTGSVVALFNPRRQQWNRHFSLTRARIEPLTASGRTTVLLLHLNDRRRLVERETLAASGRYPSIQTNGR
jgi:hypothetical protein